MGFFKRLANAVRSNTSSALEELESSSAGALREQRLRELDGALADSKRAVAKALAEQKKRELELSEAAKELDLWTGRQRAAQAKEDARLIEAARERVAAVQALHDARDEAVEQQKTLVEEMRERLRDTDARIVEMKREILLESAGVDAEASEPDAGSDNDP